MKTLITLLALIILPFSLWAQLPTAGLVAWYPFCGNTLDYSGHGYNLHDSGAVLTTDRFGNANCAYHYSGLNNEMTRTPPMYTDTGNFTYACWMLLDTTGNMVIIANGNLNLDGYEMLVTGSTLLSPGGDLAVIFGNVNQYFPTPVVLHVWHHIVLRRRAVHTFDFIIDTTLVGTWTAAFNNTNAFEDFTLGMDFTNGTNPFHGKIDDAAVYNRALTDSEIKQLYHFNPDVNGVTLGSDTTICSGSLILTGPAEPTGTTYLWSTGSSGTTISVSAAGNYWLSVASPFGCKSSDTINVHVGSVAVNLGPDTMICPGSSLVLSSPTTPVGSTYSWSIGAASTTITVSSFGTYWLSVSNGGCTGSDTVHVSAAPLPVVALGNDTSVCSGSPFTLQSIYSYTGATYTWNTGAVTSSIHPMTTGTYWLQVTNSYGCKASDTINVSINPFPVNLGPDTIMCPGNSITLSSPVTPAGSSYSWSTGATSPSIVVSGFGTFWLNVTNGICTGTDTVHISPAPMPVVFLGNDTAVCTGSPYLLQSLYGYSGVSYEWNTGATTPSIYTATSGAYWLQVTNSYGCRASDTVNVSIGSVAINLGHDTTVCTGTSLTLSSPSTFSGSSYLWSTGATSPSINITGFGTYWLKVSNGGCVGTDTIHVANAPVPQVALGNDTAVCFGIPLTLQSIYSYTGATYLWNTGAVSPSITAAITGNYWLHVTIGSCSGSDTVHVKIISRPVISLGDTAFCVGGSIDLVSNQPPGAIFLWSNGSTANSIIVSVPGTYWVSVSDSGCSQTDSIHVVENPLPVVDLGADIVKCAGQIVFLKSSTSYTSPSYEWSTGASSSSLEVTTTGTYWLTVTVAGCSASDTVNVSFTPLPIVNIGTDTAICYGDQIALHADEPAGASYLWNNGSTDTSIVVSRGGEYTLTVTENGCSATGIMEVTMVNQPIVYFGPDTTLCTGDVIVLPEHAALGNFVWSDGSTLNTLTITTAGTYWATITNICGSTTDSINISYTNCDLVFPSGFTPNGDGKNDIFRAVGNLAGIKGFELNVYNRWGQRVFYTTDIYSGWNGIFNGVPQDLGTFYYLAYYNVAGEQKMLKGDFQLIR